MIRNIAVASLSRGVLGEAFAQHEVEIGLQRLAGYGVNVRFMPNARRGIDYLTAHPEARAADLLQAFRDPGIDMILCAIGGDDTYRLLPYLFDHDELRRAVTGKVFLGFSDTTVNHMMLHKVGLPTFKKPTPGRLYRESAFLFSYGVSSPSPRQGPAMRPARQRPGLLPGRYPPSGGWF